MNDLVSFRRKVITGDVGGPHLLVLGGVHGDEFESMPALRRLMKRLQAADLRGRVSFIPVVNEAAYWRGQRTGEDGLDLARTVRGVRTARSPSALPTRSAPRSGPLIF